MTVKPSTLGKNVGRYRVKSRSKKPFIETRTVYQDALGRLWLNHWQGPKRLTKEPDGTLSYDPPIVKTIYC